MKINIGTNKGNITRVEVKKRFIDITYNDVMSIATNHFGEGGVSIIGWCPSPRVKACKK